MEQDNSNEKPCTHAETPLNETINLTWYVQFMTAGTDRRHRRTSRYWNFPVNSSFSLVSFFVAATLSHVAYVICYEHMSNLERAKNEKIWLCQGYVYLD